MISSNYFIPISSIFAVYCLKDTLLFLLNNKQIRTIWTHTHTRLFSLVHFYPIGDSRKGFSNHLLTAIFNPLIKSREAYLIKTDIQINYPICCWLSKKLSADREVGFGAQCLLIVWGNYHSATHLSGCRTSRQEAWMFRKSQVPSEGERSYEGVSLIWSRWSNNRRKWNTRRTWAAASVCFTLAPHTLWC